jgi:hypothetical protein
MFLTLPLQSFHGRRGFSFSKHNGYNIDHVEFVWVIAIGYYSGYDISFN